jgi:hypothetical protein
VIFEFNLAPVFLGKILRSILSKRSAYPKLFSSDSMFFFLFYIFTRFWVPLPGTQLYGHVKGPEKATQTWESTSLSNRKKQIVPSVLQLL